MAEETIQTTKPMHTPGPWVAGRPDTSTIVDGYGSKWIYTDEEGASSQYVAVASGKINGDWEEVMANAHLIAAAPELLEALEAVVAVADRNTQEFDAARAAIRKAKEGR